MRVLIVENGQQVLKKTLQDDGWKVDAVIQDRQCLAQARSHQYQVIVLDLLAKENGLELLQEWRSGGLATPVLLLAAKEILTEKLQGFELGADDYLARPFAPEEFKARVLALGRRSIPLRDPVLRIHDLEINPKERSVKRGGRTISLTPREYDLLLLLASRPGRLVTRSMILEHFYKSTKTTVSNIIEVYIRYLRQKIDRGFEKKLILTRWGQGYLLQEED